MGGQLLMQAVRESGARLLPIDSEHNAIFQCMPVDEQARPMRDGISKVLLTASGGLSAAGLMNRCTTPLPTRPVPTPIGLWGVKFQSIQPV